MPLYTVIGYDEYESADTDDDARAAAKRICEATGRGCGIYVEGKSMVGWCLGPGWPVHLGGVMDGRWDAGGPEIQAVGERSHA